MEAIPVVEVVEVDCIEDAAIVCAAYGTEDCSAGFIGMDVTSNSRIESCYGLGVKLSSVGFSPMLRSARR